MLDAPARWLLIVIGALTVCLAAAVVGRVGAGTTRYFYFEFGTQGRLGGLMTVASAFLLAAGGVQLATATVLMRRLRERVSVLAAWGLAGLGLLYLGADELLQLHERWDLSLPLPSWLPGDVSYFAIYAAGALAGPR